TRLTAAGSALLDECSRRVAEIQEHMLSTLGDEQCEQLIATLEACVDSLHGLPAIEDGCPDLL
ncbi:MAG: hypothetical protein ACRDFX_13060, partial [Chloroflexota bacterium]